MELHAMRNFGGVDVAITAHHPCTTPTPVCVSKNPISTVNFRIIVNRVGLTETRQQHRKNFSNIARRNSYDASPSVSL